MDKRHVESKALPVFVILDLAALSLLLVAFFVPYWFGFPSLNVYYGLWFARSCLPSDCRDVWYMDVDNMLPTIERWDLVRAFETVAVISGVISLIFGVLMYMLRHKSVTSRSVTQGMFFATALLAGLTALIGLLLFISVGDRSTMMWSPILTGVAAFLFMFTGIFTLVLCRYDPNYSLQEDTQYTIEQTHF